MHGINGDAAELREYVAAIESTARSIDDSSKVREIADRIAVVVDPDGRFGLSALARTIPSDKEGFALTVPHRSGTPVVPRNRRTDEAFDAFYSRTQAALADIERWQARAAQNSTLSLDDRRELVLKTVAAMDEGNGGEPVWFHDVQWTAELPRAQAVDAVEHWLDYGAIRSPLRSPDEEDSLRLFRLTSKGRERAAKGPQHDAAQPARVNVAGDLFLNQHGSGNVQQVGASNIASVAYTDASNVQNAIDIIRQHLQEYPDSQRVEVQELLEAIAEEQAGQKRPSRLKTFFDGILRATKAVGNAVSPVIEASVSGVVKGLTPG